MSERNKRILRNVAVEILIYGTFLVLYLLLVLRLLDEPLTRAFRQNLIYYAFAGLGLIVVQAVVLERVTAWLLDRLHIDRLD